MTDKEIIEHLQDALGRLTVQAIHYRNTGIGVQFLDSAIQNAENVAATVRGIKPYQFKFDTAA